MRIVVCILALLVGLAGARAGEDRQKPLGDVPLMHEEAEAAGLHSVYDGPWEFFVGGGGAALDCDGSGFPSVFLAGGKNPARLFVNKSKAGGPLKFEEKALDIGADPKLLTNVIGAYPLDIDGDGHMDLFVLRVGGNLLLKGGPNCTFTLANHEWNFDGDTGWTTSFAAEWEPGQKFPTLAIGHYVDRDAPGSPWGTCADNSLYRPQAGDKPDYSERTPLAPGFCALSMLFTDWNKSGTPSLRVSNDRQYYRGGEEQMWRIEPGKTPRLYSRADGWRHLSIYGMGIAEGDLDGSGYPQYFLTSMGDEKLQKLDPDEGGRGEAPVYRDIAGEVGVTAHIPYAGGDKRPSTAWHAEFADFNNDGLSDIFVSKGNLEQMPDFAAYDPSNLLLGQWNGKFAEGRRRSGDRLQRQGPRRAHRRLQSRRAPRHPADQSRLKRPALPQSGRQKRRRPAAADGQLERDPPDRAQPQSQRGRGADYDQDRNPQPDALRRRWRRRRLRPFGLHPCRSGHSRARGNPGAMA